MSTISTFVRIDIDDVLSELSDEQLLDEVKERGLTSKVPSFEGDRREDLVRALNRKDWEEADYLLRTYFLRKECRDAVLPAQRDPATGRPVIQ